MVFVTIGTQEPFDRLIQEMDKIAIKYGLDIVSQVSSKSKFKVKNMKVLDFVTPGEFEKLFIEAELIVAHAGMGTIISALVHNKSLIVLPREKILLEHRSDHQLATAKHLEKLGLINVAWNIGELESKILDFMNSRVSSNGALIGKYASSSLIKSIRKDLKLPE